MASFFLFTVLNTNEYVLGYMADNSSARTPGCHLVNKSNAKSSCLFPRGEDVDDGRRGSSSSSSATTTKEMASLPARPEPEDKKRQKMSESFNQPDIEEVSKNWIYART